MPSPGPFTLARNLQAFKCAVAEPRLALLRLAVLRAGAPVAQTVVPVHLMRPGLRWVQLYDPSSVSDKVTSDFIMTRLLVLVQVESLKKLRSEPHRRASLHPFAKK